MHVYACEVFSVLSAILEIYIIPYLYALQKCSLCSIDVIVSYILNIILVQLLM